MSKICNHFLLKKLLLLDKEEYKIINKDEKYLLFEKNFLDSIGPIEDIFNHNFDLINFFIIFIDEKIDKDDGRKHILFFLKGILELQITIFSSFSHNNYLSMFSLIRVHIENLFHILWLSYNWEEIVFKQEIDIDNYWDTFLYSTKVEKNKKFSYGNFLKEILGKDPDKNNLEKDLFGFDFLSKFTHGGGLYSVGEYLKHTGKISEQNYNKFYSDKGLTYILFIQWATLYLIKELFKPNDYLFSENKDYILNLNDTIGFLEQNIIDLQKNSDFKNNLDFEESIIYFKKILCNNNIQNKLILRKINKSDKKEKSK